MFAYRGLERPFQHDGGYPFFPDFQRFLQDVVLKSEFQCIELYLQSMVHTAESTT